MELQQNTTDRIISRSEFMQLTNMSRTTLWRLLNSGDLPSPVKVKNRVLGFRESDYLRWLEESTTI